MNTERVLATDVRTTSSRIGSFLGLRFRTLDENEAFVMWSPRGGPFLVDMICVTEALDVLWIVEGTVQKVETLRRWVGFGASEADVVVELPAGAADGVEVGDRIDVRGNCVVWRRRS